LEYATNDADPMVAAVLVVMIIVSLLAVLLMEPTFGLQRLMSVSKS